VVGDTARGIINAKKSRPIGSSRLKGKPVGCNAPRDMNLRSAADLSLRFQDPAARQRSRRTKTTGKPLQSFPPAPQTRRTAGSAASSSAAQSPTGPIRNPVLEPPFGFAQAAQIRRSGTPPNCPGPVIGSQSAAAIGSSCTVNPAPRQQLVFFRGQQRLVRCAFRPSVTPRGCSRSRSTFSHAPLQRNSGDCLECRRGARWRNVLLLSWKQIPPVLTLGGGMRHRTNVLGLGRVLAAGAGVYGTRDSIAAGDVDLSRAGASWVG